jgi:hypothetical protein
LGCHIESGASLRKCSAFGLIIAAVVAAYYFSPYAFLQMIRADFSMTTPIAWQEHHNIIGLKQALEAARLALFLFF